MPLSDDEWAALARGLRRAAVRAAPGWTDANAHDPGVSVLELLAYALDELAYRNDRVSDDARVIARRVAERARALAGGDGTSDDVGTTGAAGSGRADGALVRPRFFSGQLLTADDFTAAQDYVRQRFDRRNRLLHGAGVVEGLAVSIGDDGDGAAHVVVAPGLAFDRFGREIFVGCAARVAVGGDAPALVVSLSYAERTTRTATATFAGDDAGVHGDLAAQATRVLETFAVSLGATPADDAVPIARLRRWRGRWRLDPRFRAARTGR